MTSDLLNPPRRIPLVGSATAHGVSVGFAPPDVPDVPEVPDGPDDAAQARTRARTARVIVLCALALGIALRVLLALVNTEANDPHLGVIRIIAFEHRFPAKAEDWEAFQPKLYHVTVAAVWRLLPTRSVAVLTCAAQLVSCAAGVLTLVVVLRFLRERALPAGARVAAFTLVALSPGLIAISAQATNDAFVILFATLTIHYGVRFFARWRTSDFLALAAAATLAGLAKGNGLVVVVAVLATFAAACAWPAAPGRNRRRAVLHGAAFVALVVPTVALVGPYASYQREFGTPFVTNWQPSPKPHLFAQTFVERPGLTSVAQGLFTFRLLDLLRHPASNYDRVNYPRHRTSLWTRVYAQTNSAHFENWPRSWGSSDPLILGLTRLLFVLGLVPAALLGVGAAALVSERARRWRATRGAAGAGAPHAAIFLAVATIGYLAFAVMYAVRLRDYSSMKAIFILPALLGFVAAFGEGAARCDGQWARRPRLAVALAAPLALLAAGYVADVTLLIVQLHRHPAAAIVLTGLPG